MPTTSFTTAQLACTTCMFTWRWDMFIGKVEAFFWDGVKDGNPYSFKEMANFRVGMFREHIDQLFVENLTTVLYMLSTDGKHSTVGHMFNVNPFEMCVIPFIKGTNI